MGKVKAQEVRIAIEFKEYPEVLKDLATNEHYSISFSS